MPNKLMAKIDKFYGLKFSPDGYSGLSVGESPDMLNFKITDGYKLTKRKGYEALYNAASMIRGAFCGIIGGTKKYLLLDGLYLYSSNTGFENMSRVNGYILGVEKVFFFPFAEKMYILTGYNIYELSGNTVSPITGYVPTVMIECAPDGSGTPYEDLNFLSNTAKQIFNYSNTATDYQLALDNVVSVIKVSVDGIELDERNYMYNDVSKKISILSFGERDEDPRQIEVTFTVPENNERSKIISSKCAVSYGGDNDTRAFVYGAYNAPNVRYHTGMVDGKPRLDYFPTTGFSEIGNGLPITSIIRHYDRQIIFTEKEAYYSFLEYYTDTFGRKRASFPVYPLSSTKGNCAFGQAVLMQNDPVTITKEGICRWISTNVRDEKNAQIISDSIARAFLGEKAEDALVFDIQCNSELYICFDDRIYIYNYRLKVFYYYEAASIKGMIEDDGDIYFFTDEKLCLIGGNSDDGNDIEAIWISKKLDFGDIKRIKNISSIYLSANMCAENTASVSLSTDTDESAGSIIFDLGGDSNNDMGIVNSGKRIRKKRFSLAEITLSNTGKKPLFINEISISCTITDINTK